MEKNDIIQHVQDLTEHKADNRLDYGTALELRIAKFVKEKKFWWRRYFYAFTCNPGQAIVDLKSQDPPIQDIAAIRKLYRIDSGKPCYMPPVWDIEAMMNAQYSTDQGTPDRWTIEPGAPRSIRLIKIPDITYNFKMAILRSYYPDPSKTDFSDLVPADLHYAIVDGLKMDIMEFLYGPSSDKYAVASQVYLDSVEKTFEASDEFTAEATFSLGAGEDEAVSSSTTTANSGGW